MLAEIVFVVKEEFTKAGPGTPVSLSSVFLEVAEARLPSAIFWTPLRAAWTIWSWVRDFVIYKRVAENDGAVYKQPGRHWKLRRLRKPPEGGMRPAVILHPDFPDMSLGAENHAGRRECGFGVNYGVV